MWVVLALASLFAMSTPTVPTSALSSPPSPGCLVAPTVGFFEAGVRTDRIGTVVGSEIVKFIGYSPTFSTSMALFDSCGDNIIGGDQLRVFTWAITSRPSGSGLAGTFTGIATDPLCTTVGNDLATCPLRAFGALNFVTETSGAYVLTISTPGFRSLNLCVTASLTVPVTLPTTCAQPGVTPTLFPTASASVLLGATVSDTARLAFGVAPTGSITFNLYGPDDASCSNLAFTDTVSGVSDNGDYASGTFTPAAVGVYRWTTSYSGDGTNGATSTPCNAADQSVTVATSSATLTAPCGTVELSTSAGIITDTDVSSVPSSPPPPEGVAMPCGLIGFTIENLTVGQSVTITMTVPVPVNALWKRQHGAWTELTGATFAGNIITFHLTDGGDSDSVSGQITDPAAPAVGGPVTVVLAQPTLTG